MYHKIIAKWEWCSNVLKGLNKDNVSKKCTAGLYVCIYDYITDRYQKNHQSYNSSQDIMKYSAFNILDTCFSYTYKWHMLHNLTRIGNTLPYRNRIKINSKKNNLILFGTTSVEG